jgi:hypothetical protein
VVPPVGARDVYEVAYLCGGPHRVALTAVAAMAQDGRITISRTRHRVQVVHRRAGPPAERAVLDAVPSSGKVLGPLLDEVAHSAAVRELTEGLRAGGLVHTLAGHPHLSAAGRAARKELEDSEAGVAVLGTAGIADAGLRGIFETPDPPPGGKLVHGTPKKTPRRYDDIPPDPPMPMHPGISGHW